MIYYTVFSCKPNWIPILYDSEERANQVCEELLSKGFKSQVVKEEFDACSKG